MIGMSEEIKRSRYTCNNIECSMEEKRHPNSCGAYRDGMDLKTWCKDWKGHWKDIK